MSHVHMKYKKKYFLSSTFVLKYLITLSSDLFINLSTWENILKNHNYIHYFFTLFFLHVNMIHFKWIDFIFWCAVPCLHVLIIGNIITSNVRRFQYSSNALAYNCDSYRSVRIIFVKFFFFLILNKNFNFYIREIKANYITLNERIVIFYALNSYIFINFYEKIITFYLK